MKELTHAVEQGLRINALIRDAIAQFLYPREDWGATTFSLEGREHLREVQVGTVNLADYEQLLCREVAG